MGQRIKHTPFFSSELVVWMSNLS